MLSPSTIPVYKGDSGDWPFHFAFISFHMHNYGVKRCESKVERLRATHMLANHLSIAIFAMSVKRESIFSKNHFSSVTLLQFSEYAAHAGGLSVVQPVAVVTYVAVGT